MIDTEATIGMYGPTGWAAEKGINECLRPFCSSHHVASDFFTFRGAGAKEAEFLLEVLPEQNLQDRQNDGPLVEEVLKACLKYPDALTFEGYVVGNPRWDERVSIDGFTLRASALCEELRRNPSQADDVWNLVRKLLRFTTSEGPDDLAVVPIPDKYSPGHGSISLGWWLWWD